MRALIAAIVLLYASVLAAHENPARVDPARSQIIAQGQGAVIRLGLSHGVPFRVFHLTDPERLIVDFQGLDWQGIRADDLLQTPGPVAALRFGPIRPGWSRLVMELSSPMIPDEVAMPAGHSDPTTLQIILAPTSAEQFAQTAGAPKHALAEDPVILRRIKPKTKDGFTVVIDPGHGGIDPGAERGGVVEKDLMLGFAKTLAHKLNKAGIDAVLTRADDSFVALDTRVAIAHQAQGDVFLSLHADILSDGGANGATVYVLSDEASDTATAHLAARHDRADVLSGADLTGTDDQVASVLLDLARQETEPRSTALAEIMVKSMFDAGGPLNKRPLRHAGFSVLKSADIPSILIELGFLSSERDLANLRDPEWRAGMAQAITEALITWRAQDVARARMLRQ